MRAIDRARSSLQRGRAATQTLTRRFNIRREIQARTQPGSQRPRPAGGAGQPRTDVSPEQLAARPWLRFYDPNVPLDLTPGEEVLPGFLRESARRFPDQPAIIFYGRRLSYRELDAAADHFAAGLADQGVQPGDRVALLLPNCPQFVIAYYGALRAGAIVVPCNPLYVERELEQQLRDAGAKALVTLTVFFKLARPVSQRVGIERLIVGNIKDYFPAHLKALFTVAKEKKEGHRVAAGGPGVRTWTEFMAAYSKSVAPPVRLKPDDVALYQYTGGTTGLPKGALLTHRSLATNARMCWAWLGDSEKGRDITLAVIPFFHVYGMTAAMNLTIYAGGALAILPRFVASDVLKAIQRYRPTMFPGVPAMYIALINHPDVQKYDLSSIEGCISGAAPLPLQVATRFEELTGAKLIEGFGMTEASPVTHGNPVYGRRKEGSIGLPFPGVRARIVDLDSGERELPPGEIGELVVAGPMVMQGYYNRPGETASALRNGWLYTGDIARMDEDGYFYIVDRKKDMILSGGFNVYPRDVEEVLYQHPAVREAVVIGAPSLRGDEMVKAFVVLKEGETAGEADLIAFCRERLTGYKTPRVIEFREELPKTLIGKHLRRVLVEQERRKLEGASPAEGAASPAAPVPATVATAQGWRARLAGLLARLPRPARGPQLHLPRVKLPFGITLGGN